MKRIVKKNQIVLTLLAVMIAVAGYLSYAGKFDFPGGEKKAQAGLSSEETVAAGLLDISDEDILKENQAVSKTGENGTVDVYVPAEGGGAAGNAGAGDAAAGSVAANDAAAVGNGGASGSAAAGTNVATGNGEATGADMPGEAVLTSGMTVSNYVSQAQLSREQIRSKSKETLLGIINNEALGEEQKQEAVSQMVALTAVAEKENAAETLLGAKGFANSVVCINGTTVDVVIGKAQLTDAERAQVEDIVKRKAEAPAENVVITLMDMGAPAAP